MNKTNLIPIALFLIEEDGITSDQYHDIEDEGSHVYEKYGKFIIPIETNIENGDGLLLGMMIPVEALNYLHNLDIEDEDMIEEKLLTYCLEESLVKFVYFNILDNKFYVKVIDDSIQDLDTFCKYVDETNELIESIEDTNCNECIFVEICPGNKLKDVIPGIQVLDGLEKLLHDITTKS